MYAQTTCFSPTILLYILHLFSIAYKYIYMNWKERLYTNWVPLKQTENWYTMPLRTYSTHVWWDKSGKCWWGHLHNTVRFSDHSNHKLKISQRQNKAQRTLIANLFLLHQLLNGLPSLSLCTWTYTFCSLTKSIIIETFVSTPPKQSSLFLIFSLKVTFPSIKTTLYSKMPVSLETTNRRKWNLPNNSTYKIQCTILAPNHIFSSLLEPLKVFPPDL